MNPETSKGSVAGIDDAPSDKEKLSILDEVASVGGYCTKCGQYFRRPKGQRQMWCPTCAVERDKPYKQQGR
jgi:uncharacterized OB-fold protein